MEEWKTYTLGELSVDGKGSYGIGAPAVEYSPDKYTYLRITDINDDGTLAASDRKSVDAEGAENYILKENDIVFARTGNSTGRAYLYDSRDGELVYAGFLIKFSLDPNKVNPKILKYYTHSKPYYDWVRSFDSGATRGNINAQTFASMPIELPSRTTQDSIVDIMSAIDDKIRNNNRINHNLEEQAQALYKSWFVDFEPFRNGKFIDSELGLIPEGWKIGKINDVINLLSGFPFKSSDFQENGNYQLITIKGVQDGYLDVTSADMLSSLPSKMPQYCILNIGDILISLTGNVGRICIVDRNNLLLNQRVAILSPKNIRDSFYVYTMFRSESMKNELIHIARGTAQLNLSPIETGEKLTVIPPDSILESFSKVGKDTFNQYISLKMENIRLMEMRDALLPKLMSGDLKLNEIDC